MLRGFWIVWLLIELITLFQSCALNPAVGTANIPTSELNALQALFNATNGDSWDWLDGRDGHWDFSGDPQPCDPQDVWQGLYCTTDKNQYFIEEIDLAQYNLVGTIPSAIGSFAYLTLISLSDNTIVGAIPDAFYNNTNVVEVGLDNNYLEGTISSMISRLSGLQILYLQFNNLWGDLPSTITSLTALIEVALGNNQLNGTIPEDIGSLRNLNYLGLEYNKMVGVIPSSIGQLSHLRDFYLENNTFNGSIPSKLVEATNLQKLHLNNNLLTGRIPEHIGNLNKLTALHLGFNFLTGTMPTSMCSLINLEDLYLENVYINGTIPDCIGNLTLLVEIQLYNTNISGSLPSTIGSLTLLTYLAIYETQLNGSIPNEIGNMVSLIDLILFSNQLTGTIPFSIGSTSLTSLELYANKLSGTLPNTIVTLKQMEYLYLSYNQLNGTLPSGWKEMTVLSDLQLDNNSFSGSIPAEFFEMPNLEAVYFTSNKFDGQLPNISALCGESELDFGYNYLTGPIPESIVNCRSLVSLTFEYNYFSMEISDALFELILLRSVFLNNNALTGTIPDSFCQCSSLTKIAFNNNALEGELPSNCSLSYLQNVELQYNDFTGSLPDWGISSDNSSNLSEFTVNNNHLSGDVFSWLFGTGLSNIYVSNNLFSGTIGTLNYPVLEELQMFSNLLSGSLPVQMGNLRLLRILLGNNNQFTGPLENIFNFSRPYERLSRIDLSENQLTGSISSKIFDIKPLTTFEVSVNCLRGTIPSNVCNAKLLSQLIMDGVSSATECQKRFFPHSHEYQSYYLEDHISGTVPSCLFSLPFVSTLHLSGNELTGSLPSSLIVSPNLTDLSLSHNQLTGSIPDGIQTHTWDSLDLSYNKLNGVLMSSFAAQPEESAVSLEVNRLSGVIPGALQNLLDIDILNGNEFSCNYQRSDLPEHDQYKSTYQCGSNFVNSSLYVFIALITSTGLIGLVLKRKFGDSLKIVDDWILYIRRDTLFETTCSVLRNLRRNSVGLCAIVIFVLMPTYIVLSHYYGMYTHSYTWQLSAAYLSGLTPAVVLWVLWLVLVGAGTLLIMNKEQTKSALIGAQNDKPRLFQILSLMISSFLLLLNAFTVTMVNVAYIYVNHHYDAVQVFFMQLFVVVFKLVWNGAIVRKGLKYANNSLEDDNFAVHLSKLALFNNIVAPFIATAFVSSDCFYNVIVTPDDVTTSLTYTSCITVQYSVDETVTCVSSSTAVSETNYVPPFIYSYQCASTFIAAYTNVFVYMFIVLAFVVPIAQLLISYCMTKKHLYWITRPLKSFQWAGIRNGNSDASDDALLNKGEIIHVNGFIAEMVVAECILVSFGVVYPPLAIVIVTAMVIRSYTLEVLIGRLLMKFTDSVDMLKKLHLETERLKKLNTSLRIIVPVVVPFYAYLLFDTLGDKVGWRAAMWLPFTVLGVGWIGSWLVFLYQRQTNTLSKLRSDRSREVSDDKL